MAGNIARILQTTSSVMATFFAMFTEQFQGLLLHNKYSSAIRRGDHFCI